MSQYERDQFRPNVAPNEEKRSFLMEYVRKIYHEREGDFSYYPVPRVLELEIAGKAVDDDDARLSIVLEETDNIRGASFIVKLTADSSYGDFYEFDYRSPEPIKKMVWSGADYEKEHQDDAVGQEYAVYCIERILLSTGVAPPVTQMTDERKFWQIATSVGVEVLEEKGAQLSRYFEQPDDVGRHQRKLMAYRAIWAAVYGHELEFDQVTLRGALGEDVMRYCMQRMRHNSAD